MTTPASPASTGSVQCFVLEPTERVLQALRRYTSGQWDDAQRKMIYRPPCPLTGGYHTAQARIEDAPVERDAEGHLTNGSRPSLDEGYPPSDPRWPTHCACGHAFEADATYQLWTDLLYRRTDTGEETTQRDAAVGAMLRTPWMRRRVASQDADPNPLAVVTPAGLWVIDECATDCPHYGTPAAEKPGHHCWTRSGTPPLVTASPSINFPGRYHGWLRNGMLQPA